ncbi:tyrosine-type recombinase/integrase [Achromobacter xylosoxidans]
MPARPSSPTRRMCSPRLLELTPAWGQCQVNIISVHFHWHDLRHTRASWHVQHGTPLMVLKELGGWETIEMVQKYAHLAPSHVAAHANAVKFVRARKSPHDGCIVRA